MGAALNVDRWTSLADHVTAAEALYGDDAAARLTAWLDGELALVEDAGFAAEFAANAPLPGIPAGDYAHRLVRTARGELVGGIRFYGLDLRRPFIEIAAHTFPDLDALAGAVAAEWAAFGVRYLRLRTRPGALTGARIVPDQTVHAARCGSMRPDPGTVRIAPVDPSDAWAVVQRRYRDLEAAEADLARDIARSSLADLDELHTAGTLRGIYRGERLIGVLATAPSSIGWICGQEVQEEVIAGAYAGHGYAAAAQAAWAAEADPDTVLCGTIDHRNVASRRSAERAGRPTILASSFVRLD